jgi:hypothetical protein
MIGSERKEKWKNVRPVERSAQTTAGPGRWEEEMYEMTVTSRATDLRFSSSQGTQSDGIGSHTSPASFQPNPLISSMISLARRGEQTKWI